MYNFNILEVSNYIFNNFRFLFKFFADLPNQNYIFWDFYINKHNCP